LATLMWAPQHAEQIETIRNLAMSLPPGFRLYVKEHPCNVNRRPAEFYRQLSRIPPVRLIDASHSVGSLIDDAQAVVTITGTVGWECLLRGKPVITLGRSYYGAYEGCIAVRNWNELAAVIGDVVTGRVPPMDEDSLISFVASVYRCTRPGDYWAMTAPSYRDPNNTAVVADSFVQALGEHHPPLPTPEEVA